MRQTILSVPSGAGFYQITRQAAQFVQAAGIQTGRLTVFARAAAGMNETAGFCGGGCRRAKIGVSLP
ncbi:hypothetical protein [Nitratireductor sp. ZSWI3]|uniref:hypothetical protein n=1 Tax=Nitratireductor sp. ZSWI3 TaxID=2966359 RepID=UPI00214F6C5C|nr:hypothetical protein [Nitratireductor sp. ZSWI3]MCR4267884.1 hypothetical protein [Nitratireductor sp. ZSWI3]